jgi:o-succinylbenzoate synthase
MPASPLFKLDISRYDLPMKRPFRLAGHRIERRSGLLLRLRDGVQEYLAEAAPLPGFSPESLDDITLHIEQEPNWPARLLGNFPPFFDEELPATLQFAFSTLWHERKARLEGHALQTSVYAGAHRRVPVNATLGMDEAAAILEKAGRFYDDGFRTFKLKVGVDAAHELDVLRRLREGFPDAKLRIDANAAWQPQQALDTLRQFSDVQIEYCEQPLDPGDEEGAAWLLPKTSIPIAADEAVRSFEDARHIIQKRLANLLIIKPMLLGSISSFLDILSLARNTRMDIVVTTALEAGIGRRTTAKLASMIPFTSFAHGLATGGLLEHDLCPDGHLIRSGCYHVADIARPPELLPDAETRLSPVLKTEFQL